jgi:hypothetical protein
MSKGNEQDLFLSPCVTHQRGGEIDIIEGQPGYDKGDQDTMNSSKRVLFSPGAPFHGPGREEIEDK